MKWVAKAASVPVCEFNGEKEESVRVGVEDAVQEVKVELKKVVWEDGEGFMEISAGTPISESLWITRDDLGILLDNQRWTGWSCS